MRRPSAKIIKVTFNAPTVRVFLLDAKGIRIRLTASSVMITSTQQTYGDDVVGLVPRSRSGAEAQIDADGTSAATLLQRLVEAGLSEQEPFFTLDAREGDEWITLTHFSSDNSSRPTRHVPCARIWFMADDPEMTASRRPNFDNVTWDETWSQTRMMIIRANNVVTEFENGRGIGRPTHSYIQAKRLLQSVHRFYRGLQAR